MTRVFLSAARPDYIAIVKVGENPDLNPYALPGEQRAWVCVQRGLHVLPTLSTANFRPVGLTKSLPPSIKFPEAIFAEVGGVYESGANKHAGLQGQARVCLEWTMTLSLTLRMSLFVQREARSRAEQRQGTASDSPHALPLLSLYFILVIDIRVHVFSTICASSQVAAGSCLCLNVYSFGCCDCSSDHNAQTNAQL